MTPEVAEKAWPLLKAYAEGKEIQYLDSGIWYKAPSSILKKNWFEYYSTYRIAPLKKRVAFDHNDKSKLIGQWIKNSESSEIAYQIINADPKGIYIHNNQLLTYPYLYINYTFLSGAACCKEIEVES